MPTYLNYLKCMEFRQRPMTRVVVAAEEATAAPTQGMNEHTENKFHKQIESNRNEVKCIYEY